jgi:hypothetical protein
MSLQSLRFALRVATTEEELRAACRVRAISYGHHVPELHDPFLEPDATDRNPNATVFVVTDKSTGEAIGTARICTNMSSPLQIESACKLPQHVHGHLAEITRLAILPGAESSVRLSLVKALYLFAVVRQVRWLVIGARAESLIRQYKRLGFLELLPTPVPLAYAGNFPHTILGFNVTTAERNWFEIKHPFYDFMVHTFHPDIDVLARV